MAFKRSRSRTLDAIWSLGSSKRRIEEYGRPTNGRQPNKRPCLPSRTTSREMEGPPPPAAIVRDHEEGVLAEKVVVHDMGEKEASPYQEEATAYEEEATPDDGLMTVSLLKHQRIALAWMAKREQPSDGDLPMGGILADDQGLGKTISTMSLILKNRSPRSVRNDGTGGTLVVCPTSLLRQWATELKTKATEEADLTFLIYHGPTRKRQAQDLGKYDVVITTYAIVALENPTEKSDKEDGLGYDGDFLVLESWRAAQERALARVRNNPSKKKPKKKKVPGPLSKITWFRVILDEAQCIRTASTITARAVWGLKTPRRWCLTGTPLQNKLGDLYSYLRFLRYPQYELYVRFHNNIKRHVDKSSRHAPTGGGAGEAYKLVRRIFSRILLRRTKTDMIAGKPILDLPPRIVNLEEVEFTDEEAEFYHKLQVEIQLEVAKFVKSGKNLMSYFIILMIYLLRMRQACNHFSLVTMWKERELSKLKTTKAGTGATQQLCVVCQDVADELAPTSCGHACCQECVNPEEGVCPVCDAAVEACDTTRKDWNRHSPSGDGNWASSSKIRAVMKKIEAVPAGEKALVFSQWTAMLDLLEPPLRGLGIDYCRIDGRMSISARDQAVRRFNTDPGVKVILMSLKAASLGLNMVAASHVLLLDVWWNPTVEEQAIDRAHRIGQTRPVIVTRFYVADSVEQGVLGIQAGKRHMVESALGTGEIDNTMFSKLNEEDFRILLQLPSASSPTQLQPARGSSSSSYSSDSDSEIA